MTSCKNWDVALSSSGAPIDGAFLRACGAGGIRKIEVSMTLDGTEHFDFEKAKEEADLAGVTLHSLHLPFAPETDVATFDEAVRAGAVERLERYMKKAAAVGIRYYVIHPCFEGNIYAADRPRQLDVAAETLALLGEYADSLGGVLCVEDLPRICLGNCASEILYLISKSDKLRVCFDTNHLLLEDNLGFIRALGDKIVTLHVSDYEYRNECHWLPGEGKIDWQALIGALEEIGYAGPFLYELGLKPSFKIDRRLLTPADFAENFRTLQSGKTPAPIGTPTPEDTWPAWAHYYSVKQF